jgi:multiple sugar transport system ATP-binding protein
MDVAAPEQGNLVSKIYSVEPTGDQTLVTTWAGEQLVVVKADRAFRQAIDTTIAFKFRPDRVFLFDQKSGERI